MLYMRNQLCHAAGNLNRNLETENDAWFVQKKTQCCSKLLKQVIPQEIIRHYMVFTEYIPALRLVNTVGIVSSFSNRISKVACLLK